MVFVKDVMKHWNRSWSDFAAKDLWPGSISACSAFCILWGATGKSRFLKFWTCIWKDCESTNWHSQEALVRRDWRCRGTDIIQLCPWTSWEARKDHGDCPLETWKGRYKKLYNRKARDRRFRPGEEVLILLASDNNKLLMQWKSPFRVAEHVGKNDYSLQITEKIRTFHLNLLKKYAVLVRLLKNVVLGTLWLQQL